MILKSKARFISSQLCATISQHKQIGGVSHETKVCTARKAVKKTAKRVPRRTAQNMGQYKPGNKVSAQRKIV